jgi:hypothetical protein
VTYQLLLQRVLSRKLYFEASEPMCEHFTIEWDNRRDISNSGSKTLIRTTEGLGPVVTFINSIITKVCTWVSVEIILVSDRLRLNVRPRVIVSQLNRSLLLRFWVVATVADFVESAKGDGSG